MTSRARRPLVIAHRTCPLDAPENSIAGVRTAARLGADAVELDVRRCRGGVPVLMHDPLALRTAGRPWPVRWLSSAAFQRLRLDGGPETAPTFRAVLRNAPPGLRLAVDVKDPGAMAACLDAVLQAGLADRTMLWCRRPAAVSAVVTRAPQVATALLRDDVTPRTVQTYLEDAAKLRARAVSLHERVVTPAVVAAGQRLGLQVFAWVQSPDAHERMVGAGVDGLVTDWPAQARALLS
jgi:glycerophosphoryl diester phosphodiesterase